MFNMFAFFQKIINDPRSPLSWAINAFFLQIFSMVPRFHRVEVFYCVFIPFMGFDVCFIVLAASFPDEQKQCKLEMERFSIFTQKFIQSSLHQNCESE
jgi:hypothetical protein